MLVAEFDGCAGVGGMAGLSAERMAAMAILVSALHWLWYVFGVVCILAGCVGLWWLWKSKISNSEE